MEIVYTTLVALQSARLGEGLIACATYVGSYVLMAHDVHSKARTFREDLVAVIVLANKAPFNLALRRLSNLCLEVLAWYTFNIQHLLSHSWLLKHYCHLTS